MDRQDLKAQLTKTQELLSIAIKEKDTADMILEAPRVFFFIFWEEKVLRTKKTSGGIHPSRRNQVV